MRVRLTVCGMVALGLSLPLALTLAHAAPSPMAEGAPAARFDPAMVSPASPSSGRAEDAGESHWYGGSILATDAAAIGLVLLSAPLDNGIPLGLGLATYAVVPPILHARHGQLGRAVVSLGLRVGLPVGLSATFVALSSCGEEEWLCGVGEVAGGVLVGSLVAMVADQLLANDRHPVVGGSRRGSLSLVPTLQPVRGGATAGLFGTF